MSERGFALVRTREQWLAASADLREKVQLDENDRVTLEWTEPNRSDLPEVAVDPGGLAFDGECRLYRSIPEEGRVLRMRWLPADGVTNYELNPVDLFPPQVVSVGDFVAAAPSTALIDPRALAVDDNDRLFVAESGTRRLLVYDLWSNLQLRAIGFDRAPVDLSAHGARVLVLLEDATLLELTARGQGRGLELPAEVGQVARIAVSAAGTIALLVDTATAPRVLLMRYLDRPTAQPALAIAYEFARPFASDLEFDGEEVLHIARRPGESILRISAPTATDMTPLRAPGYDGSGLVRTPEGRVAWWAAGGLSHGLRDRVLYAKTGRITTARLDALEYQAVWGRVFVDACLPRGTNLRIGFLTSDLEDEEPVGLQDAPYELYERDTGSELPWANLNSDPRVCTYETPVHAPAGRFLWITLELTSDTRASPLIASMRAEHAAHPHLRRLPRTLSRQPRAADFLHRYLSNLDGVLSDLDARSALRHILIDPRTTPAELLPWLAGFVGLLLDERWSTCAKRQAIAEAAWLFRYRGTVPGLQRFLEICLGGPVILIEHFKLRGQGGALLGDTGPAFTSSVLGVGFRVGGQYDDTATPTPMSGTLEDAFRRHAHRFTVIIPGQHGADALDIATRILEVHRPAHTVFDICTTDAGMRVGRGLHIGLSAIIGRSGGFRTLQVQGSLLGRDAVIGRPVPGVRVQSSRIGQSGAVG